VSDKEADYEEEIRGGSGVIWEIPVYIVGPIVLVVYVVILFAPKTRQYPAGDRNGA